MEDCHIFSRESILPIFPLIMAVMLIIRHRLVPQAALISTPITLNPSVTAPVVTPVAPSHVPPMANVAPPLATFKRLLPTVAVVLVVRLTKTANAAVLLAASVTVPNVLLPSLVPHTPLTAYVVLPVPPAGLVTRRFAAPRVRSKTVPQASVSPTVSPVTSTTLPRASVSPSATSPMATFISKLPRAKTSAASLAGRLFKPCAVLSISLRSVRRVSAVLPALKLPMASALPPRARAPTTDE